VQFNSTQIRHSSRSTKTRSNSPAQAAGCIKSFRSSKQAQLSRVSFQAQFGLSFALRSEAAQLSEAIALKWTCGLEPFNRAGSRFENSGLHPYTYEAFTYEALTGPTTLDRCRNPNVIAPGEYSKRFFALPSRFYGGCFRPATARQMPARSRFGALSGVNPDFAINCAISALWPIPDSTTTTPRGANTRWASGMSAR
jgi:hypothetical protein